MVRLSPEVHLFLHFLLSSLLRFSVPFYALLTCGSGQRERNFFDFPKSKNRLCPVLGTEHIDPDPVPGEDGAELRPIK